MKEIRICTPARRRKLGIMVDDGNGGAIAADPNPISFDAGFRQERGERPGERSRLLSEQFHKPAPWRRRNGTRHRQRASHRSEIGRDVPVLCAGGPLFLPDVGVRTTRQATRIRFSAPVPVAYGKLQLTDSFSISAGKLPTLVGAELAFTPQNINIERGFCGGRSRCRAAACRRTMRADRCRSRCRGMTATIPMSGNTGLRAYLVRLQQREHVGLRCLFHTGTTAALPATRSTI